MTETELRRTALYDIHAALGASFTDFGGWDMPLRYSSDLLEHHAVRRAAGIFDLSHMGELWVRGPQAAAALSYALVGRVLNLAVGRARYMMMVTPGGGIIDDLIVYRVDESCFLVVPNAGNRERVSHELEQRLQGFDLEFKDKSLTTSLIAVQGPLAVSVLEQVVDSGRFVEAALRPLAEPATCGDAVCETPDVLSGKHILSQLRYYAAVRVTIAGHTALLARTGYTGEDGFEIFCTDADAADLWEVITAAGEQLPPVELPDDTVLPALSPCGLAARDSLRLEAGMPLYGHELTEEITPFDAGLGGVVAFDKGEFVGRSALLERSELGGTEGSFALVALTGSGRRAARPGCTVLADSGEPAGEVTSGLLSPTLGYPVALARVSAPVAAGWEPGASVQVDVRGRTMEMTVVAPPFYKRQK